jgi:hypothetical protein
MADKDDAESRELASRYFKAFCQSIVPPVTHVTKKGLISCSRTKRMTLEAVGPSSFASRKKKPKKDQ